ncbi:MAG: hypothetical protein KGQ59_11550 [Bdellovibrionales bacterium]|nr:hypothetical protein [Bdellovibrionales bacterium]
MIARALILIASISLVGCFQDRTGGMSVSVKIETSPTSSASPQPSATPTGSVQQKVTYPLPGMKSGDQIFSNFSRLTGVGPEHPSFQRIMDAFEAPNGGGGLKLQLPAGSDLASLTMSGQKALLELAALFCEASTSLPADQRSEVFGEKLDFTRSLDQVLSSDSERRDLAQSMVGQFLGPADQKLAAEREAMIVDLMGLIEGLRTDSLSANTGRSVGETKNLAVAACSAVLGSLTVALQ